MQALNMFAPTMNSLETEFVHLYQAEEAMTLSKSLDECLFLPSLAEEVISPQCSQSSQGSIGCGPLPDLDFDDLLTGYEDCENIAVDFNGLCSGGEMKAEDDREIAGILDEFLNNPQLTQHLTSLMGGEIQSAEAATIINQQEMTGQPGIIVSNENVSFETVVYDTNQYTIDNNTNMFDDSTTQLSEADLLAEEDTAAMGYFDEVLRKVRAMNTGEASGDLLAFAVESGSIGPAPQEMTQPQIISPCISQLSLPVDFHRATPSPSVMSDVSYDTVSSANESNAQKRRMTSDDSDSDYDQSKKTKKRRRSSNVPKTRSLNKDAASRYRQRKKEHQTELEQEAEELEDKKKVLAEEAKKLEDEVKIIADLLMTGGYIKADWRIRFQRQPSV